MSSLNLHFFQKAQVDTVESIFIKGKGWEYEKEARRICNRERAFPIPKYYLQQVCFGMNTVESDISLIKQLIDNAGYSIGYYQIERTEKDFGFKAVKI